MKKTTRPRVWPALAIAAAAFAAGTVHAQSSLQIYGILDAGVQRSDTGESGGGKKTELATGNSAGTRLGFRGTEDLGGGLKALFNLEMGISNDTGTLLTFGEPAGTVFGRRSFVGLQGGFGEVLVGRDYTPGWQTIFRTDRFRFGLPGTISTSSGLVVSRASNGIFYSTPVLGGFRGRLAYTFGAESPSPRDLGRLVGVNLEYKTGGLFLSAAAQTRSDLVPGSTTQTTKMREHGFGANYETGAFGFSGGFWRSNPVTATVGATDESRAAWLGASMKVGVGEVLAQVTRTKVDVFGRGEGRAITAGLAYIHWLSKRTSLYAAIGRVNNDANARLPLNTGTVRVGGATFGADPRATLVGIRHDF
jgi:predicted porin